MERFEYFQFLLTFLPFNTQRTHKSEYLRNLDLQTLQKTSRRTSKV